MEHTNIDRFGGVVKSVRQSKGITQTQLSERLSISTRYLKGIENSGRKPSYDLLVKILLELDIPADAVFPSEHEEANHVVSIRLWQKAT